MDQARLFFASDCGGNRFWPFSLISRAVWLQWRLAVAPITGGVSLLGSAIK
ncbi:hypothetical protein Q669_31280 [Labrenzia sp. C1B10]|nr:hypothetical protein Q669_31280 [Labrenzia sp. C1B10]ERS09623.1 hypothetical protein Q675_00400 [Labrenzia sp. C1B70]